MNSDDANLLLCALFSQKATVNFYESEWVEPDHIFLLIGGGSYRVQVDPFSHPVLTDTIREARRRRWMTSVRTTIGGRRRRHRAI